MNHFNEFILQNLEKNYFFFTNGFNLQKVFGAERIFLDMEKKKTKQNKTKLRECREKCSNVSDNDVLSLRECVSIHFL